MEDYRRHEYVLVITSGGFDPLHDGHIEYLKRAKFLEEYCGYARDNICIVNNDDFLLRKKGYKVLSQEQRMKIIDALEYVDCVYKSNDEDDTVCKSIQEIYEKYNDTYDVIVFAKGGDRNKDEIPEAEICKKLGIKIIDGLGEKIESSSQMMKRVI